jgi:hypothetical protein
VNHGWRVSRMPPTQHCIVFPNVSGASQHYFIDTGMVLDQHSAPVIICDLAVIEMAKLLGYISRGEAEQMQEKLDAKEQTINKLLERNDELEKFKSAVTLISNEKKKAIAAEKAVA